MTNPAHDHIAKLIESRGAAYGPPAENHQRTALLWMAYLEAKAARSEGGALKLNADDICFLNILQKIARCLSEAGPSKDSLLDIQGFAENLLILNNFK